LIIPSKKILTIQKKYGFFALDMLYLVSVKGGKVLEDKNISYNSHIQWKPIYRAMFDVH
jgi:hypothetical protein